ncbi:MAG TPA: hypothetical protein VHO48_03320, partial [Anaerolineaceae bacterium]|nr:hypothetical protein [Anaerolineaceae bacterium]
MNKNSTTVIVIIVAVVLAIVCCGCVIVATVLGLSINTVKQVVPEISNNLQDELTQIAPFDQNNPNQDTLTPDENKPNPSDGTPTDVPGDLTRPTPEPGAFETLRLLQDTVVPNNDLLDLADRLGGKGVIPETVPAPSSPLTTGARQKFFVSNVDTNENFQVDATLHYVSDHLYFWIEDGIDFDQGELNQLGDEFENKIYPTNREFFGSEWSPGVDNDPHLYVLFARNLGFSLAGYFSSADEYPPQAHEYSNAHEMFMLNADNLTLSEEYTKGVLAHEFQHMIHWYRD